MTLNSEDLVKADTEEEDFFDITKKLCLTTKDAYRLMGIGRSAFWKIAKELPSVSLTGGRRYWCRKGIERWIEANTRQGHNA